MKRLFTLLLATLLVGCASVSKVDTGAHVVGTRLTMTIDGPWNHLDFPAIKPAQVWTMEGVYVDELRIYSGIKDGQAVHPESSAGDKHKSFVFKSSMQSQDIVALFEGTMTLDGSLFKLTKLEPFQFGGRPGFRIEYDIIRKIDNVQLKGFGYGAVSNGELFAMLYQAPRLTFFERYRGQVESIARSAMISG